MVRRIAIIPARGGSKRLPSKNIIDFFGKPLLAWSIKAALRAGLFDMVFVSTDSAQIADIARVHGAEVPFLRDELADDHSNISQVTVHALEQIAARLGMQFSDVAMLQATCPVRDAEDVRSAVRAFEDSGADFQMSCFSYGWINPWWAFRRSNAGDPDHLFPDAITSRSQDLPNLFGISGAICLAHVDALLKSGTFHGPGRRYEPLSWMSAVDIDDEDDLHFARAAYLVKHRKV
jgi:N-acylneuraminate cytidylyltransferase